MSYNSETAANVIGTISIIGVMGFGIPWASESGKESARTDILEKCQNHQPVTIDGIEIHCGVIHSAVNVEAARYRKFKQCVKVIEEFTNEQL
jgi:hypothetical protein